jgi:2-methylisocitrate lyase-like PEP mutase family enzyme
MAELRSRADAIATAHNRAVERAAAHTEPGADAVWEDTRVRWDEDARRYYCDDLPLARRLIG